MVGDDDGFGVVEKGIDDDVKEELVVCELLEGARPDHVELAELLKVDEALLRSPAEPVVELGRCGKESNEAPMLFWRSRSSVRW